MGMEPVPETYLNELTQLIAREDYIDSILLGYDAVPVGGQIQVF
jgi:hypothetical protein